MERFILKPSGFIFSYFPMLQSITIPIIQLGLVVEHV